jgi:chromosome segregation ATPase
VAELKADLAKAKTDKQQLQEQHSSAQAARKAAEEQAARLQAQVEQLQFLVDEGHAKADSLEQQVGSERRSIQVCALVMLVGCGM